MLIYPQDIRDVLAIANGCDESGREITFEEMIDANAAMVSWLEGGDSEVYFDALAQAGVDPIAHLTPIFKATWQ
ncbi:hypothetical protein [Nostoc sp.]|uniref:hypothetical protein n=1 Tax=Nostoc sp. TaxID=1180 RepID=UPI002FF9D758